MATVSNSKNFAQHPHVSTKPWAAAMIRPLADQGLGQQASFLRQTFQWAETEKNAFLRISALGLYRAFINGRRVGDDQLTPGWTSYQDRLSFQTYAVDDLLKPGENTLDIWLGDGWYRSPLLWARESISQVWGEKIAAIAEITTPERLVVATDASWHSGVLPVLKSGIYFGEIYDARQENLPAEQGSEVLSAFDPRVLIAHEISGVKELSELHVVAESQDEEGRTVYDFGQNAGAYVAITVEGERGARVLIEHSEILDGQGQFNNANYRSAEAKLEYVLKGGEPEHYRPIFTFQGFRYARVQILGHAKLLSIKSIPISSASQRTGEIQTASALVNKLVENTVWSLRSNFIEVPTDCPQRDERLGWTGDAQVFAPTACYLYESQSFWKKWLRDVMADQRADGAIPHVVPDPTRNHEDIVPGFYGSTGWGDAICVVPWVLWTHYGDREILEETFPAMIRWVDFLWSISDGPIVQPPRKIGTRGFSFGDWLQPSGPTEKPFPTIGDDAAATIYLYISSALTAKVARTLGDKATELRMCERANAVKTAFAHEFIAPSGRLVYDDQTSYALAFLHDLIPEDKQAAAAHYFKATIARAEGRIGTGFIGTPALLPALVKIGERELAASLFLQEEVPGWLYQIKKGATTIWERWDAIQANGKIFDPAMNSYNHYAYGAVCQWLFEGLAGFRPDPQEPGFRHIIFEPTIVPALSPLRAQHESIAGTIAASWTVRGQQVTYEVELPANSHGSLILSPDFLAPCLDGQAVERRGEPIALSAGRHTITFRMA